MTSRVVNKYPPPCDLNIPQFAVQDQHSLHNCKMKREASERIFPKPRDRAGSKARPPFIYY